MGILIGVLLIVGVIGLIVIDIWLLADTLPGNTFSEMLREGAKVTTFFPWALAILIGRWFHPVDSLKPVLGNFSIPTLMITSYIIVVLGDILKKKRHPIPSWIIVLIGIVIGALCVPVTFS